MREIKFRYRIELEGRVYSFFYWTLQEIEKHKGLGNIQKKIKSRDLYTGLKDKNGKEIYCKDKFINPYGVEEIVIDLFTFFTKIAEYCIREDSNLEEYLSKCEVIGNEFENKEG